MRARKLKTLLPALIIGVCASAAVAQTVAPYPPASTATPYPPADQPREVIIVPASPPPATVDSVVIMPPSGTPVPDPSAESKCRYASSLEYWDCVNSHNGGG